jgi:hypothetical protein
MLELNARIFSRKTPVDGDGFLVASLLSCFDLPLQFGLIGNALAQQMLA